LNFLLGGVDRKLLAGIVGRFKMAGRLDVRVVNGKIVVFDMAHTEKSILRLLDFLEANFKGKKWNFLVSIMKNKNVNGVLRPIYRVANKIIVTSSSVERGFKGKELQGLAYEMGMNLSVFEQNGNITYMSLLKKMGRSDVLVVTGSHFLVGDFLKTL